MEDTFSLLGKNSIMEVGRLRFTFIPKPVKEKSCSFLVKLRAARILL